MIAVDAQRIISFRYTMKNASGDVLADTTQEAPVSFIYGSGEILPGIEAPLKGLKIGEKKCFSLSPNTVPELNETFYFDVIIDDIRCPSDENPVSKESSGMDCGPDCQC